MYPVVAKRKWGKKALKIKASAQVREPVGGRLRVALCYSDCHNAGGVERVLREAAAHLSASCDVSVLARSFSSSLELPGGVLRQRLGGVGLPLGFSLPQVRRRTDRLVRSGRWDVWAGFGVQAAEGSVVWVQSVHAAWWEEARVRRRGWRRCAQGVNPFHRIVLKMEEDLFRHRRYRRLIALTPTVRRDLERFYGVDAGDVEVLPNGFSPVEFHPGLRREYGGLLRRACGIPEDAWVVLFVANEWERKGLLPLLEAVALLGDARVHLVAVGRLPKAVVVARAQKCGIADRVHVVGRTASVNRWFGVADAFALPTVYEAWGMVVIEALAAGVPVLTSCCAGAAVAVRESFNGGLLEDPTDVSKIARGLRALRDGAHVSSSEIAGSVAGFEWGNILARYERILRACS